jgi:hypothetical protein
MFYFVPNIVQICSVFAESKAIEASSMCHFGHSETARKQKVASGLRLWFLGVGVASARPLAFFSQFTMMRSTCRTFLHAAIPSVLLFRSDGSQRTLFAVQNDQFASVCNFKLQLWIQAWHIFTLSDKPNYSGWMERRAPGRAGERLKYRPVRVSASWYSSRDFAEGIKVSEVISSHLQPSITISPSIYITMYFSNHLFIYVSMYLRIYVFMYGMNVMQSNAKEC